MSTLNPTSSWGLLLPRAGLPRRVRRVVSLDSYAIFFLRVLGKCWRSPVPLMGRGTQALVSFASLASSVFCSARRNAVLRRALA